MEVPIVRRRRDNWIKPQWLLSRLGQHRSLIVTIGSVVLAGGLFVWAWNQWGTWVTSNPRFQVSFESLELPPQPKWIQSDIRKEVVQQGSLEGLSLLDEELTVKVRHAVELHPWVASVNYVSKRAKGNILVELAYREPAVMVETKNGWWPVDTKGVLLPPADFTQNDPEEFLQVRTPFHQPAGDVGMSFGHPGVVGAADLAKLIAGDRQKWGVVRVNVHHSDPDYESGIEFELELPVGSRIQWGSAPGKEQPGESKATEKLHRLRQLASSGGFVGRASTPLSIDIRYGLSVKPLAQAASHVGLTPVQPIND